MVPEGWEKTKLGKLVEINSGVAPSLLSLSDTGRYPYVKVEDMNNCNKYQTLSRTYTDDEGKKVGAGAILFPKRGAAIMNNKVRVAATDLYLDSNMMALLPNEGVSSEFLFYSLIREKLYRIADTSTIPQINNKHINPYPFLLPPLPEQKKIAQILSTWDQAITATERLLENSQQRKKGLMQQLLTGKKRLPGFEGEWVSSRLDELFTFKKGKGLSKSALVENGNHKCVLYGELYTKYGEVIRDVVSRCDDQDGLASKRGDILLPSSTTTNGIDLANATAVIEDGILLGGDIIVLRPIKQQDPIFFSHLITHIKKHEIAARAQGITIIHLYGSDLKDLVVKIPAKEAEQKVISEIMTTADKEIVGLSQRLASLKQEKKALMQQLLTGKRRVQVEAA